MRAAAVVVLGIALAPLAGCSFDLGFDGTRYRCGAGGRCPTGQSCVGGFCEAAPDDGGFDAPDAAPTGPCGNLTLLRDSFDAAGAGQYWYDFADTGSAITENGGQLVIDINANVNAYAGYIGRYLYDLHGASYEGEVSAVFPTGSNTILELRNHLGNVAQVVHQDGMIAAATYNVPGAMTYFERAWNPAERYWRIREDNGDMVWEVSTNRTTWDQLHRRPAPFDVSHVRGAIAGGGSGPTASQARFDGVNPDPPGSLFCTAAQLVDDFAAAPLAPLFDPYTETGCTTTESGGNLILDFTAASGNVFCGINAFHLYDLTRGNGVVIDSAGFPSTANFLTYIQFLLPESGNSTRIESLLENGSIEFRLWVNNAITDRRTLALDRTMHRYWRTRADGVTAIFETSPDRTTWTERWRVNAPQTLSPVELNIGAGLYAAVTPPLTVTLPGVNAD